MCIDCDAKFEIVIIGLHIKIWFGIEALFKTINSSLSIFSTNDFCFHKRHYNDKILKTQSTILASAKGLY